MEELEAALQQMNRERENEKRRRAESEQVKVC